MARIEQLLTEIADPALRRDLEKEVAQLKDRLDFGLVFERHHPESVLLGRCIGVREGDLVQLRKEPKNKTRYRVAELKKNKAVVAGPEGESQIVAVEDLLVVKDFGDPIYPSLTSVGAVNQGGDGDPHVVINGENFHALQMLAFTHAGHADVIYIDPPYNTGARDWKYNNDYVDQNDRYRHSKWLAFMERRLRLAGRLLAPNGVLICAIDEKEYLRLGLLLEQVFRGRRIQMVSSLINPAHQSRPGAGFGRNDEYLFFVMSGKAAPRRTILSREWVTDKGRTYTGTARWDLLRRSGASGSARSDSPGGFYPIYVDPDGPKFVKIGDPLPEGKSKPLAVKGAVAVLPIRKNGTEGRWQLSTTKLREYTDQGRVMITGDKAKGFVISYLKPGEYDKVLNGEYPIDGHNPDGSLRIGTDADEEGNVIAVPASQWRIPSHDSTQYGSRLLAKFLPDGQFPYPKSLYAVRDAIRFFVADNKDALIIDFFAGSGTTLHATMLLNAEDEGRRRSILITNNDVGEKQAKKFNKEGLFEGDEKYEAHGIFESVTRPRTEAAITGKIKGGKPVIGSYLEGRKVADGFPENVEFFSLDYLDPDRVELGLELDALHSLMWLIAGAQGGHPDSFDADAAFFISQRGGYAVLFDILALPDFIAAIRELEDVRHLFLITDDQDAFTEMTGRLGPGRQTQMVPRNYLAKCRLNTRQPL